MTTPLPRARMAVLGTGGVVVSADRRGLAPATDAALAEVAAVDRACSRFRDDSDLARVNRAAGRAVRVGPTFVEALLVALRAARVTDGDVDPTVGRAIRTLGYDRDFARLPGDGPPVLRVAVAPRWTEIEVDPAAGTVRVPAGVEIDLGATAKALAADRAAAAATVAAGCGVLVSLGGDVAVAGPAPAGGWPVLLGDRHDLPLDAPGPTVAIHDGGLATSGTTARRWRRGGEELHHIVDPRTGGPAAEVWRTVSVAAASCVDANIASTAAIIRGAAAVGWLAGLELTARLVAPDGSEQLVGAWAEACTPVAAR